MTRRLLQTIGCTVVFAFLACTPPAGDEPAAEEAVMLPEDAFPDAVVRWDNAARSGDVDQMLAQYAASGAKASPPDGPTVSGVDGLRGFLTELLAEGGLDVTNLLSATLEGNDVVAGHGTYVLNTMDAAGEEVTEKGKWLSLARRQADGSLLMLHNIWNRDAPPAGAKAPAPIAAPGPAAAMESVCADSPLSLDQSFEAAIEAGDVPALVAHHAADGLRLPPGMTAMRYHPELSSYIASRVDPFSKRVLDLTGIEQGTDGNLGWTAGQYRFNYTPRKGGEAAAGAGSYMTVSWKGDDGCWRYKWVLWNSDEPWKIGS